MPSPPRARTVEGVSPPPLLRRPEVVDALVGLVFAASVIPITYKLDSGQPGRPVDALTVVCILVAAGALTVRRRWPTAVLGVITVVTAVYAGRNYPGGPFFLALFVAVGTLASEVDTRAAVVPIVIAMVPLAVVGFVVDNPTEPGWAHLLYLSWAIVAFLAGKAVRDRRELLRGLRERAQYLEETREEEALRRVAEERVRIARDLHDIVAHNIAGISLRAASAAHVADERPEDARRALLAIRDASRQTLDDLRSTLHLLREGDEAAPLVPTSGLADLPELVESVTRSGVPVGVEVRGDGAVPTAVDSAAYRIVQEALTNVMRHAGPASATVIVDHRPDALEVLVEDDGGGNGNAAGGRHGHRHGIAGMQERAAALGGTVDAGPRQGGGFRVRAHLPIEVEA
jgi:signal transduction histidine kinase